MADYDIELGIGLQQNAKQTLESEIANIKRQLSKDKSLAITAHLSDNSLATIQHQLDAISKNLSIKINTVDLRQLINGIPNIAKQAGQQAGQQTGQAYQQAFNNAIQKNSFKTKFDTNGTDDIINNVKNYFETIAKNVVVLEKFNGGQGLNEFVVKLTNASGEAETLKYRLNDAFTAFEYTGGTINNNGIITNLTAMSQKADSLSIKLDKLKAKYTDVNAPKAIKDSGHLTELNDTYDNILTLIEAVRNADNLTSASMVANAERAISALDSLITKYQNEEYIATSLRTKDIPTAKAIQSNRFSEFKSKIQNSNVPLSEMQNDLDKLEETLNAAFDSESLTKFLNELDIAESKFKALKEQFKSTSNDGVEVFNTTALENQRKKIGELQNQVLSLSGVAGKENELAYYVQLLNEASDAYSKMYAEAANNPSFNAQKNEFNERILLIQQETNKTIELTKARKLDQMARETSKTTTADSDNLNKIELSIKSLQNRMELFKNQSATKLFSSHSEKAQELRDKFYDLAQRIKDAEAEYKNLRGQDLKNKKKEVADLNKEFSNLTNEVAAAGYKTKSLGQIFVDSFKSFSQYYFAGGALVKSIQTIDKLIDKVTELNKSFVNLKIATNGTDSEVASLMSTYNKMGKTLGATTVEVADSADQWLRQGYSIEDTNRLIEASMIQSKIGQLESADSTKYLTSALKGYKLEVEDAMSVVDKMSAVDLKSATSLGGLAEGMSEVANSARLAGISMDQLLGYEAVIGETTQDSMSSVGQSLKRIFARMGNVKAGKFVDEDGENLNDVEKVLGKLGIKLRDSQNEFRNFGDVLYEVGGKWSTYSSVEQNAITTALAGTQQSEKLRVLFEGFGKALEYTQVAANSAGTAMEKFGAYQDGIEAKTKKLQASIESLAQTVLNSDLISTGIDGLNLLINGLDTIIGKLGSLGTVATIGSGILGAQGVS